MIFFINLITIILKTWLITVNDNYKFGLSIDYGKISSLLPIENKNSSI